MFPLLKCRQCYYHRSLCTLVQLCIVFVLCVFTQNTWAQWELHVIDNAGSGADGIKFSDVNNDGKLDIVTGWEESGVTKIYIHPGLENIKKNWPAVIVGNTPAVEDAVFMDANNDGKMDVVSLTEKGSETIFVHWNIENDYLNPANWKQEVLPESDAKMKWLYAEPMQVDEKNGVDLIAAGKESNAAIGWFEAPDNPDDLRAWKWHEISEVGWIMSIYKKDMDLDGDHDLVITDRNKELMSCRWLENPGIGEMQEKPWVSHLIGAEGLEVKFI